MQVMSCGEELSGGGLHGVGVQCLGGCRLWGGAAVRTHPHSLSCQSHTRLSVSSDGSLDLRAMHKADGRAPPHPVHPTSLPLLPPLRSGKGGEGGAFSAQAAIVMVIPQPQSTFRVSSSPHTLHTARAVTICRGGLSSSLLPPSSPLSALPLMYRDL